MKIGAHLNNLPIEQKRESGKNAPKATPQTGKGTDDSSRVGQNLDPQRLQKFVDTLKGMEPKDLHRVEELRQQVEDGSYQANADDMVDNLLSFLNDGRLEG